MNPQTFQLVVLLVSLFFGAVITIMGALITSNIKQFKADIDKENKTQNNRLNSHSDDLKNMNGVVIKNEAALKANKENDINERTWIKDLLHAELSPIKSDLEFLKGKAQ